jgi:hypothetical protein
VLEVCAIHISYFFYDKMNANQVASSKVNVKKQNEMKTKTSSMLEAEQTKTSSMLEAEQDEDEDFMYARTDDGTLCRFGTEGLTEKEKVTFGWQETEADNFEDMRSRIGDPEVCTWISYEEYLQKKKTV